MRLRQNGGQRAVEESGCPHTRSVFQLRMEYFVRSVIPSFAIPCFFPLVLGLVAGPGFNEEGRAGISARVLLFKP